MTPEEVEAPGTATVAAPTMRNRRIDPFWVWTAVAVVLALVLRSVWVSVAAHHKPIGLYDPARYVGYGEQIARGRGYTDFFTQQATAYYPPGYPWFLGLIALVQRVGPFGSYVPLPAGYVQAVLGALTAGCAAIVGRRIVSARAGIIAAFVIAIYPNLIFHTGAMLSETLYNFLFMAFLAVLLFRPWPAGLSTRRVAGAAVLFGLAVLVRPISLAIVPVLGIVWWASTRSLAAALRWTAITVGVVVALVLPWTIRNEIRMHAFIPLSTNTGDNLCIGHHPDATGAFSQSDACNSGEGVQFGYRSEVRNDRIKTRQALDYLTHHLGQELRLTGQRAKYMFNRDDDAVSAVQSYYADRWLSFDAATRLRRVANTAYLAVAVVGVVGLLRLTLSRRPDALLLVLSAVATAAVPLLFFGDPRFKVPVIPLLIVAAAAAVSPFEPAGDVDGGAGA